MNFITAHLLLAGLSEEDAFWSLIVLVHQVVPGCVQRVCRCDSVTLRRVESVETHSTAHPPLT